MSCTGSGPWLASRVSKPLIAMNPEGAGLRFAVVRIADRRRTFRCTAASRTSGQLASLNRASNTSVSVSRGLSSAGTSALAR